MCTMSLSLIYLPANPYITWNQRKHSYVPDSAKSRLSLFTNAQNRNIIVNVLNFHIKYR